MQQIKFYLPGISLILMAVLIFTVPEILVAMISVFIMTMGVFILYIGHGLRKSEIELRKMDGIAPPAGIDIAFINRKSAQNFDAGGILWTRMSMML